MVVVLVFVAVTVVVGAAIVLVVVFITTTVTASRVVLFVTVVCFVTIWLCKTAGGVVVVCTTTLSTDVEVVVGVANTIVEVVISVDEMVLTSVTTGRVLVMVLDFVVVVDPVTVTAGRVDVDVFATEVDVLVKVVVEALS
jgi:hypothetical protein